MRITKFFAFLRLLCLATLLASILPAQAQNTCQSRPFNTYEESVSAAYIAYYGRPADTGGLAYWAEQLISQNGNLGAIIDAFGNSAEYRQRFGSLSNRELIRNLYQQLYGRDPDQGGWLFYEMWLDTGVQSLASIAISILAGTEGSDVAILNNRKAVAQHFITSMEALGSDAPTITDGNLLANLIAATDGSAVSLEDACAQINTLIKPQSTTTAVLSMSAHEVGSSGAINNLSGSVNSERYFKLTVPAGVTDLVIRTSRGENGMGDADLRVSRNVRPTLESADCFSATWFSSDEECSFAAPVAGDYFIMLRGYIIGYSGVTLSASWRGSTINPEVEVLTGFFRDSAVKGLDYASCPVPLVVAACLTGQTGADGEYQYRKGYQVRFTLGPLVVAQAPAALLHTPLTVTKSQDEATKLAQFLQSIDENSNPMDGINISQEIRNRAQNSALVQQGQNDFSLNLNRISTMVSVLTPGRAVVGPSEALAHAETSQRLLALSEMDIGKWILGKKILPRGSNADILSTSARERLRLGIWYKMKNNLQARADGLSKNVTEIDRKKNQRAAYVDLAQSVIEAGLLVSNTKNLQKMDIKELTVELINNKISIATASLKVADINIGAQSDTTKGILNAVGGNWNGALKDGYKAFSEFAFSSTSSQPEQAGMKSLLEFIAVDFTLTFGDLMDKCAPSKGCNFNELKTQILLGQSAKAIKAVDDFYSSYRLSNNDTYLMTYIAVIEYLNNYYEQAGDIHRLADIYGNLNYNPYNMVFNSNKFSTMDRLLFENLVAETKASVEYMYAQYSDALGASISDTYAQINGISDMVCNGTEDTLRLAFVTQNPWFQTHSLMNIDSSFTTQRIDWNWAQGVNLKATSDGRAARVTFEKPGYKTIIATAYGRYNDARTTAIGMRSVRVKSCVIPNEDIVGGRWEFTEANVNGSEVSYRAVPDPGYEFVNWVNSDGQTVSAVLAKNFIVASVRAADVARPVFRPVPNDDPINLSDNGPDKLFAEGNGWSYSKFSDFRYGGGGPADYVTAREATHKSLINERLLTVRKGVDVQARVSHINGDPNYGYGVFLSCWDSASAAKPKATYRVMITKSGLYRADTEWGMGQVIKDWDRSDSLQGTNDAVSIKYMNGRIIFLAGNFEAAGGSLSSFAQVPERCSHVSAGVYSSTNVAAGFKWFNLRHLQFANSSEFLPSDLSISAPIITASAPAKVPPVNSSTTLAAILANITGTSDAVPDAPLHVAQLDSSTNHVYFLSRATNLLPGAYGGVQHLYGFDPASRELWRLSQAPSGEAANADTTAFSLAGEAGKLVFRTRASNLEGGPGLHLLDINTGARKPLLTALQNGASDPGADNPVLSATAGALAFDAPDAYGHQQMFTASLDNTGLYDQQKETPLDADTATACCAALSADGRYLAWQETGHNGRTWARVLNLATDVSATLNWPQAAVPDQKLRLALSADGAQLRWLAASEAAQDAVPLYDAANPLFVSKERLH